MCNDYEQHVLWAEYCRMMASLALKIPEHQTELDMPQADDIRINDPAPIMRAAGEGIELASMTFGFPPSGPKAGPVFNFRSEGRQFAHSNRCLVPASAFFESARSIRKPDIGSPQRRSAHGDCRPMAWGRRQQTADLHDADDRSRAGCCAITKPEAELLRPGRSQWRLCDPKARDTAAPIPCLGHRH